MSRSTFSDPFETWLRAISDASWPLVKVAHGFETIGSGTTPSSVNEEYYSETEGVPWVLTGDLRESQNTFASKKVSLLATRKYPGLSAYPKGALVVAMYGATIGRLGLLGEASAVNQACCVLTGERKLTPRFLFYWLQAFKAELVRQGEGGGQPNISQDLVKALRLPAPTIQSQIAIAKYLDLKTAAIDALIAKKERFIEELRKYQEAAIAEAVRPRKGWRTVRLKHLVRPLPKSTLPAGAATEDGAYPFYVSGQTVKQCDQAVFHDTDALVLSTGGNAVIHRAHGDFSFSSDCWGLQTDEDVDFLFLQLRALKPLIAEHGFQGAGIRHLDKEWLLNLEIPIPTRLEQERVCDSVLTTLLRTQGLRDNQERALAELAQLRRAVIAEAVTGGIEVPCP